MKLEIGFGTTPQIVELPDKNVDGILYPNEVTVATTGAEEVNRSLSHPINCVHRSADIMAHGG